MFSTAPARWPQAPKLPFASSQLQCLCRQCCPSCASQLPSSNPQLCKLAKLVSTGKVRLKMQLLFSALERCSHTCCLLWSGL